MQFTYGVTDKTIKGKKYSYFWLYSGTGRKTEIYLGRAGKPSTRRKGLQVQLEYLLGLQKELDATVASVKQELADLAQDPAACVQQAANAVCSGKVSAEALQQPVKTPDKSVPLAQQKGEPQC